MSFNEAPSLLSAPPSEEGLGSELARESLHPLIQAMHDGLEPMALAPHFSESGEIDGVTVSAQKGPYRDVFSDRNLAESVPLAEIPMPAEYDPTLSYINEHYDELRARVEEVKRRLTATTTQNDADLTTWLQNYPNQTEKIGPAEEALRQLRLLEHDLEETRAQLALQTNNLLFKLYKAACRSDVPNEILLHSTTEDAHKMFRAVADDLRRIEERIHFQTWRAYPPIVVEN